MDEVDIIDTIDMAAYRLRGIAELLDSYGQANELYGPRVIADEVEEVAEALENVLRNLHS